MENSYTLYWIRQDGQGSLNMGSFSTSAQATAAIPAAEAELLDQCGEDAQKQGIEDGTWSVEAD